MFGSSKSENGQMGKPAKGANITNQFVAGTTIQGEIKAESDIRVDGNIVGTVESSAKIAIGKTGRIEGEVLCTNADIEGKVYGRLVVKELLILKKTAVIEGDIISNKLVVEDGARFNGTCSMGSKEMKPQQDKNVRAQQLQKEAI